MDSKFLIENALLVLEFAIIGGVGWVIRGLWHVQRSQDKTELKTTQLIEGMGRLQEDHEEQARQIEKGREKGERGRREQWKAINKLQKAVTRLLEREGIEADL